MVDEENLSYQKNCQRLVFYFIYCLLYTVNILSSQVFKYAAHTAGTVIVYRPFSSEKYNIYRTFKYHYLIEF